MQRVRDRIFRALSCFVLFCLPVACTEQPGEVVTHVTKLRVASVPAIVEAPTHIAYYKEYFKQEGFAVSLKINPDGKTSLEQVLNGDADIAAVTGTPVVYSSLQGKEFYILANIDHSVIHFIAARKDRGITSMIDLKGKKVAVMFGTSGQFFMDSLLVLNKMEPTDLDIINLNGPEQLDAFVRGEIDAMFCWAPFPLQALERLGEQAILLPSAPIRPCSWVIVATKDFVEKNPDVPRRFLAGLLAAEKYIQQNRNQAFSIYSKVSGVQDSANKKLFTTMEFGLSLDHSLLLDLEDQARWILKNGYSDAKQVPNYLNYIFPAPMLELKPEATSIIY